MPVEVYIRRDAITGDVGGAFSTTTDAPRCTFSAPPRSILFRSDITEESTFIP
jgi:hypothetical protein